MIRINLDLLAIMVFVEECISFVKSFKSIVLVSQFVDCASKNCKITVADKSSQVKLCIFHVYTCMCLASFLQDHYCCQYFQVYNIVEAPQGFDGGGSNFFEIGNILTTIMNMHEQCMNIHDGCITLLVNF